nr:transposase [Erythrobacter sp. QSSC1-22B]
MLTTKLHARCDARGLPLSFVLTPSQAPDVQGFAPLFRMIEGRIGAFLADRAYDADAIRYKKTKETCLGIVAYASIKLWTPFFHEA